jgi:hypothetical protein
MLDAMIQQMTRTSASTVVASCRAMVHISQIAYVGILFQCIRAVMQDSAINMLILKY